MKMSSFWNNFLYKPFYSQGNHVVKLQYNFPKWAKTERNGDKKALFPTISKQFCITLTCKALSKVQMDLNSKTMFHPEDCIANLN